ncbi:MAG: YraN family protein [Alphaproteobacteria bacterium]|nr:YraN family protein [Alphaproteobacteria bacterium]
MSKKPKVNSYSFGLWAEWVACAYLWLKSYKILKTRYKTSVGEVDIIAEKNGTLVFIEVKARTTKTGALESLTPRMRGRVSRAAQHYLMEESVNLSHRNMRFDLICVTPPFHIHHLDNAWQLTA